MAGAGLEVVVVEAMVVVVGCGRSGTNSDVVVDWVLGVGGTAEAITDRGGSLLVNSTTSPTRATAAKR